MANELYSTLGVAPDASAEEIKKAYFRELRKNPAEKNPRRHQEIREAYAVLGDVQRRRQYDALQRDEGEINRWMAQGQAALQREQWGIARGAYEKILKVSPDYLPARLGLARATALAGDMQTALQHFDAICAAEPDDLDFHAERGFACLNHVIEATQNEPANQTPAHRRFITVAEQSFQRCVAAHPNNRIGYLGVARVAYFQEDWARTREWARRAADALGTPSFEDFEPLFLVVEACILAGELDDVHPITEEIRRITPPQAEVRQYVATHFARIATMLMRARAYEPARQVFAHARTFAPDDPQLVDIMQTNQRVLDAQNQLDAISKDPAVIRPIKALALWAWMSFTEAFESEDKSKEVFSRVIDAFDSSSPADLRASMRRFKEVYGELYQCQDRVLDDILGRLDHAPEPTGFKLLQSKLPQGVGCSWIFIVLALGMGAALAYG